MYSDPSGKFAILSFILVSTVVGALFGAGISLGGQLIANDWDFSKVNYKEVISSAIIGGVSGFALAMGGIAGGAVIGSLSITGLTTAQVVMGTLVVTGITSFTGGMAAYMVRNIGNEERSLVGAMMAGFGQMASGFTNYILGGMFVASGFWQIGNSVTSQFGVGVINRAIGRYIIGALPNQIIKDIFIYG